MKVYDAVVVGAGPAGLAAAATAAKSGASVLLVDENLEPGGQYYRGLPPTFGQQAPWMARAEAKRQRAIAEVTREGVEILRQACVIDIEAGWRVAVHLRTSGRVSWVNARKVVAATGARELMLPFPGWTLPGVMTLGGAQLLAKSQGLAPGHRVVLSGSGPFLWLVAQQLIRAGVNVVAVAEATPRYRSLAFAARAWRHGGLALQGAGYLARIRLSHVRMLFGHAAIAGRGEDRLEDVVLAKLDRDWRPITGASVTLGADALCVSHGLLPATELTQIAGCTHALDPATGVPLPVVGEMLETSAAGLFAAGEALGIGGGPVAALEGRIAGLGLAAGLGLMSAANAHAEAARLRPQIDRRRWLVRLMSAIYAPRPGALGWAGADTTICRCEEVALRDIRAALEYGDQTTDLVKSRTRCGMGRCQGRICGPILQRLMADRLASPDLPPPSSVRQPLKPVPVRDLLHLATGPESEDRH